MTEEEVIEELLVEWELARNAGRSISAAELCHEHPNLVPHVAHQISLLEQTSWIVDPALLGLDAIDSAGSAIGVTGDDTEIPDSDVTVAEFIDAISSRGLFSPQQQEQLDALLPQDTTARAIQLAHTLIDRGLITEYQARVILQRGDSPLLLDRYVILDSLGGGGMGIVFKALQRSLERIVAVKVLPRHAVDSAEKVERFQREMRAAAKLSHPHVVQAYDAHESNGVYFYAMEYVPGHDLDRLIREQGPMGASEASDTIRQVAEGLAHAHQNGIVHRDVKPSNVLLSDDGTAKILDLGLARTREQSQNARDVSLTAEGLGMGTVAFMAPEQAFDARHADERSDIYSLGCTLYFLLHGRPVFLSEQPVQAVVGHRELPPPELARDREDVSPKLEALFQRMLAKSPDDRPQTMEEVVDELTSEGSRGERGRDALAKQTSGRRQQPPIAARATQESPNRGEQVKGQAEKRRRVIPAVSAALSVLALAAFAVFWSQRSTPEHIARELLQYEDTSLVLELADQSQVAAFYEEDLPTEPFEIFGLVLTPTLDVPLERIRRVPAIRSLTMVSSAGNEPLLADWQQIAALPRLEMLELDGYRLDDRVMGWVRQHRGLYSLDLTACKIPKSRLQTLSALSELRELVLMQTDTSDEDVLACNDLPQLNYLDLSNTLVTQRGLSKLKLPELSTLGVTGNEKLGNFDFLNAFPKLAALYVDGTQFDDRAIRRLVDLEQLETLHIGHTELTREGVRQILAMPNLRDLAMDGLPIQQALEQTNKLPAWEVLSVQSSDLDDDGLARLSQIRSLQYLVVAETKVTQKAIEKLRLKLPGCEVVTDTEDSMLIDF